MLHPEAWPQHKHRSSEYPFPSPANAKISSAPKRNSPARAPGIPYLRYSMRLLGACAGEAWAGEAPEGPASPKGFTGWDGPGAACGSPPADFSSGEQTANGNSYPLLQQATLVDGLRCMTEKMQEVARPVPPGGAFQGGSIQGLSFRWETSSGEALLSQRFR